MYVCMHMVQLCDSIFILGKEEKELKTLSLQNRASWAVL